MTPHSDISAATTAEQIRKVAVTIQKIRPDYSPMIEFYSQIFAAQAETLTGISPDPILIEPNLLALKQENKMPLISPVQFKVDLAVARDLMKALARLAITHAPKLTGAGEKISDALALNTIDLDRLFTALLDSRGIEDQSEALNLTPEELGFFGYNAMLPSIQACAAQLVAYLAEDSDHDKGYCPICGNTPNLAFLDDAGKKQVTCALCSHTWKVKRMGCLFCDADNQKKQDYFFSEEEKEYRVYYCDTCKNYLKTVDTRELERDFVPKLEQVATLHLDIKAREQGLTRVTDSPT